MVTPELLDFLRAQLATGMSRAEIERLLVEEGGWERADVEEGLAEIGESLAAETASPAPSPVSEPEPRAQEVIEPTTVLSVRSERDAPSPAADDFLGIFTPPASETVVAEIPASPEPASQAVTEVLTEPAPSFLPPIQPKASPVAPQVENRTISVRVDPPLASPETSVAPPSPSTPNLMDMLSSVAHPESAPSVPTATAPTAAPAFKFDLSRIRSEGNAPPPVTAATIAPAAPLEAVAPATPPPSSLPQPAPSDPRPSALIEEKKIMARSLADVWSEAKERPQEDPAPLSPPRASSLSAKRTMGSDILLRGKGANIQGLPSLGSVSEENPMPIYSSDPKQPEPAKPKPQPKPVAETPKLSPAEELAKKNRMKRIVTIALSALTLLLVLGGAVAAYFAMKGPDVMAQLSGALTNFASVPSLAYSGTAQADLSLVYGGDGVARTGAVKFAFGYAGAVKKDKNGFGDGNHHAKWSGGLSSGDFAWSTDIETDIKSIGDALYFHVLAYPAAADFDPDTFKTYWIKIDLAEIAKELAIEGGGDTYAGIASGSEDSFMGILMKDMPFTGAKDMGEETVGGTAATHVRLSSDKEKLYTLAADLYKKFMKKPLVLDSEERLRLSDALEKLSIDVWLSKDGGTILKVAISGDLDDDIASVRVKGPLAISFELSSFGAPVGVDEPTPYLSLDELKGRMDEYKKLKAVRAKDAVKINALGEIEHALAAYKEGKGRFPTLLSELRAGGILATSTISDADLKSYVFASYVKSGDYAKTNRCTQRSKNCDVYHIGTNLEDATDPALGGDADENSEIHGADSAGCSLEREQHCYDLVFPAKGSATSSPSGN